MASIVKQVWVLRNLLITCGLCVLVLWWLRAHLWASRDACLLGVVAGIGVGVWRWWALRRQISRRDRRYERNKIFVNYLSLPEVLIAMLIHNLYLAIPLGILLLAWLLLSTFSAYWWTVLASSLALTAAAVMAVCVLRYEQHHGRVYYQYNSETWSGAEGLLYQQGRVVARLDPAGKVMLQGVLWNAVSMSGETIEANEQIEVISVERLTLYVDRLHV